MRKRTSIAALLALSAFLVPQAWADDSDTDLTKWSHVAPVELPNAPAKGLVEVPLSPELLAVARSDLADLRLLDNHGAVVPYVVHTELGKEAPATSYRPERMFNAVFVPQKQSQVTVDFGPATPGTATPSRTRLDIDTPGTNFRRRVTIEASADGSSWQVLRASDWLFRVRADSGSYDKNQVTLPANDARYLRITVFNAPDDPEQVPITSVTSWHINRKPPQTAEIPTRTVDIWDDAKEHVTQIDADLGYENVPLHDVALVVEGGLFLRRVEVFGRNATTRTISEPVENSQPRTREVDEPWTRLGGGAVYVLPGGREGQDLSSSLELPATGQYRYVRVRVVNGDDAPLKITGVRVHRFVTNLDFRAPAVGTFRLFAGNAQGVRPSYDLESFAARLREEDITPALLGPLAANPQFTVPVKVTPWSEQHNWLLWTGLGVTMAVLGTLILRQARPTKTSG